MSNIRTGQLSPFVYRQLKVSSPPIGRLPDRISSFLSVQPISCTQLKPPGQTKREKTKTYTDSFKPGQACKIPNKCLFKKKFTLIPNQMLPAVYSPVCVLPISGATKLPSASAPPDTSLQPPVLNCILTGFIISDGSKVLM